MSKQVYNPITGQFNLIPQKKVLNSTSFNLNASAEIDTNIQESEFRHLIVQVPKQAAKVDAIGTINPNNTSSLGAALINGNFTDLCYNNTSTGSANKPLPAINLGAVQQIDLVSVWWWNATYTATNYKIQGSVNGTTWQDLAVNLSSSVVGRQDIPVNTEAQYIRLFCVTGRNTTYVVLSEMEAYANPVESDLFINHAGANVDLSVSLEGSIVIKNKTLKAITAILKH